MSETRRIGVERFEGLGKRENEIEQKGEGERKKEISLETHRHRRREGRLARKKDSRELRRVGWGRGWNGRWWGREKHGTARRPAKIASGGGDSSGPRGGERVGADNATMEGAEVGKMTAEPSVRHVLPLRVGLRFRSVPLANHARCRDIVTPHLPAW